MDTISRIKQIVKEVKRLKKAYQSEAILGLGMLLLSLFSFAGGYLTAREQLQEPITIESQEFIQ